MPDVIANLNSSAWKLVSHDPVTGQKEYECEIAPGVIVTRLDYYVEKELVDLNTATANANDGKRWGNGQVAASIPLNTFFEHLAKPIREGDKAYVKRWLNDPDHAGFRTFRGRI